MKYWTVSLVWKHSTSIESFKWTLILEKLLNPDKTSPSILRSLLLLMGRRDPQKTCRMPHLTKVWLISWSILMTYSRRCASLNIFISAARLKFKRLWIISGLIMKCRAKSWRLMSIICNHWSFSWFLGYAATPKFWLT
jgi:hypothetical protein